MRGVFLKVTFIIRMAGPQMSVRYPVVFLAAAALSACGGSTAALAPSAADARWAAREWPGTTQQDLEAGRSLFASRCSSCHALPSPSEKTPTDWDQTVQGEMGARARLSAKDRNLVAHYLATVSQRTQPSGG